MLKLFGRQRRQCTVSQDNKIILLTDDTQRAAAIAGTFRLLGNRLGAAVFPRQRVFPRRWISPRGVVNGRSE